MPFLPDRCIEYISATFSVPPEELDHGAALFSTGLLDSFCLVDLLAYVESEAGIRVRPTDISLENFDSVERIAQYVQRRTK